MNLPPFLEKKFKAAETLDELKEVIAGILEEYNFGILSEHERRIGELEKESLDKTAKTYQERSKFERETDEIIKRRG